MMRQLFGEGDPSASSESARLSEPLNLPRKATGWIGTHLRAVVGRWFFKRFFLSAFVILYGSFFSMSVMGAEERLKRVAASSEMVKQASAPLSSIMQIRFRDAYFPQYKDLPGRGNLFSIDLMMPLPAHRILPLRHLSMLSLPTAVTQPGGTTGLGDLRLLDIAILQEHSKFLWGIGPAFVMPTATDRKTGQGKWQAGPAFEGAVTSKKWMAGVIAQNPMSFAGNKDRADVNEMMLRPFVTYQLGRGWFVRSQPTLYFNWKTGSKVLPIDLGVGRAFTIRGQTVSWFVEPFWNFASDGHPPQYGIATGISLLYPDFWKKRGH